jgi:hypothetical protein
MNEHEELEMYRAYVSTHFSLDFAAFRAEWRQNHPEPTVEAPIEPLPEVITEEPVKKRRRKTNPAEETADASTPSS